MGSFKDVVGHRDVIQYLQNAIAENRVSQAYIVNGERGTGKKMLAKLFAWHFYVKNMDRNHVINVIPVYRQNRITIRILSG